MWTKLIARDFTKILALALVFGLLAGVAIGVDHTSTETVELSIGPGSTPPEDITVTVTQSGVTNVTSYTDTLSASRGWVTVSSLMTDVASWFIQFESDSTSDVALVRAISGASDSIEVYADQVFRVYQPPDSSGTYQVTTVRIKNPFYGSQADSLIPMTYHVVAVGK